MVKTKKIMTLCILLFFLLLTPLLSFALGIAPARTTLNFEPNLHKEVKLRIINNQNQNLELEINATGELKDYIVIREKKIMISSAEDEKTIIFEINLPPSFDYPGTHEAEITVAQALQEGKVSGTALVGSISLKSQIKINVPYEGKYVESSISITKYNKNKILFTVPVKNVGTENISRLYAEIKISNKSVVHSSVLTDAISLNSGEGGKLVASIEMLPLGHYDAVATLFFDEKSIKFNDSLDAEIAVIDITEIRITEFIPDKRADLSLEFFNNNNEEINEVYAQLNVYDGEEIIVSGQTEKFNAGQNSRLKVPLLLDLSNLETKSYDVMLRIFYGAIFTETKFEMTISDNSLSTSLTPTGAFVASRGEEYQILNKTEITEEKKGGVFYYVIAILLLIIVGAAYYYFRKKKEEEEDAEQITQPIQQAPQQIQPQQVSQPPQIQQVQQIPQQQVQKLK